MIGGSSMRDRRFLLPVALAAGLALPPGAGAQAPANGLPAVSPDGLRIAFVGTRDGRDGLFVTDTDGSNQHAVEVPGVDGRMPRWSAAGDLLFTGAGADTGTVFAVSPGGGTARIVATAPGRSPVLSPDGKRVLYLVGPWTSTALVAAETGGAHAITLAGGGPTAWNGTWSPDGGQVAYTYGDSSHILQVHVVNADGSGDRAVTHTTVNQGSAQMPAWSPDGHRLAIQVSNHATHSSAIWVVDLPGGEIRSLSPPAAAYLDETPSWFPDGTRLAFQSNRTGSMQVWTMAADGSSPRQVTGR
jgi:Tol biopolymer transport system component